MPVGVLSYPLLDLIALVRGIVVFNEIHIKVWVNMPLNNLDETQKLTGNMSVITCLRPGRARYKTLKIFKSTNN
ncbi:MAG: hypothetical protein OXC02_03075 [Rhodobacteraceae bacterium]|nr:hypothetical protein [Paracoccaceae bacterium]